MKALKLILAIFLAVGVAFLFASVVIVWRTSSFLEHAVTVDGVVTGNVWRTDSEGGGTYHPQVHFRTSEGQELTFVSNTGASPASFRANEPVKVVYEPGDAGNAQIKAFWSLWLLPIIMGGLGAIFSSITLIALLVHRKNKAKAAWLRVNGRPLQAEFTRVELNTRLTVNDANPYRIVCQWMNPATNQVHVFKSGNIWYDPTAHIPGKRLTVLMDPANPKKYWVDTGFLPAKAE